MRRIAILGATSQIASDFISRAWKSGQYELLLYSRRPEAVNIWLAKNNVSAVSASYDTYGSQPHDAVINFVGSGDPVKTSEMGASINDITQEFDELALEYVKKNSHCRYIFISSGAAYGGDFSVPVSAQSKLLAASNPLQPQDYYGAAKLAAESRHRALAPLPIVDIRVFNYFSCTQSLSARFLITDIVRALQEKTLFETSPENITRDYLHPDDFYTLVEAILHAPPTNMAVDAYSRAPIDKLSLLSAIAGQYGLQYRFTQKSGAINATGAKSCYYSENRAVAQFGYEPQYSSLDSIIKEIGAILS